MPADFPETPNKRVFTVSVAYQGGVLEPRKRRPDYHRYVAHVPVLIGRMDDADAPVAIEIDRLPGAKGTIAYRHDGETFWRPMLADDDATPIDVETFERRAVERRKPDILHRANSYNAASSGKAWLDWVFPRSSHQGPNGSDTQYEDPFALNTREEGLPWGTRWHSDDLAEVTGKAQAAADNLAVIDGIVHMRTIEPYLQLDGNRLDVRPGLPRRRYARSNDPSTAITARLDRFDVMETLRTRHLDDWASKDPITADTIRILRPEVLRYDEVAKAAKNLFGPITEALQNGIGHLASTGTIRLFCDLRDAGEAYAAGDASAFERGMNILRAMVETGFAPHDPAQSFRGPKEYTVTSHVAAHEILIRPILEERAPTELNDFTL